MNYLFASIVISIGNSTRTVSRMAGYVYVAVREAVCSSTMLARLTLLGLSPSMRIRLGLSRVTSGICGRWVAMAPVLALALTLLVLDLAALLIAVASIQSAKDSAYIIVLVIVLSLPIACRRRQKT